MKVQAKQRSVFTLTLLASVFALQAQAQAQLSVDLGSQVPDARALKEGLFPEDACKELEATGLKCTSTKPAVRYSLQAAAFRLGSAELPETLRKQLDVFAEVLRGAKGAERMVRIEGHADASGPADASLALSQRRAEAVRSYLVQKGADEASLLAVGMGAKAPKVLGNPLAAENRRLEIGRNGTFN